MHETHGIRNTKNMKFYKTAINKLRMEKKITGYTYNKTKHYC